ncbi:MAG: biotin/lipoyl-binding protein [Anaerolineaceae bacterium]|nr:biotin/lipoyl-binding protein [Anaerolineaceae bacterium]
MALYRVSVGKKEYKVKISKGHFTINGEPYKGEISQINHDGLFSVNAGHLKKEIHIQQQKSNNYTILANQRHLTAHVEKHTGKASKKKKEESNNDLIAQLPGVIISINVEEGNLVQEKQTLVVMESMKMQMDLRIPISGKVSKIFVQPGDQVEKGTLLVKIDELILDQNDKR